MSISLESIVKKAVNTMIQQQGKQTTQTNIEEWERNT